MWKPLTLMNYGIQNMNIYMQLDRCVCKPWTKCERPLVQPCNWQYELKPIGFGEETPLKKVKFLYSPDKGAAQPPPGMSRSPSTYPYTALMWRA